MTDEDLRDWIMSHVRDWIGDGSPTRPHVTDIVAAKWRSEVDVLYRLGEHFGVLSDDDLAHLRKVMDGLDKAQGM